MGRFTRAVLCCYAAESRVVEPSPQPSTGEAAALAAAGVLVSAGEEVRGAAGWEACTAVHGSTCCCLCSHWTADSRGVCI